MRAFVLWSAIVLITVGGSDPSDALLEKIKDLQNKLGRSNTELAKRDSELKECKDTLASNYLGEVIISRTQRSPAVSLSEAAGETDGVVDSALSRVASCLRMQPGKEIIDKCDVIQAVSKRLGGMCQVDTADEQSSPKDEQSPPTDDSSSPMSFWKQCISEGGQMNCAKCKVEGDTRDKGALRCGALTPSLHGSQANEGLQDCPDSLHKATFWVPNGYLGTSRCDRLKFGTPVTISYNGGNNQRLFDGHETFLPGSNGTYSGSVALSKGILNHPQMTSRDIGSIMFKRTVLHRHSSKGEMVGDVYKVGYCIKCPTKVFRSKKTSLNKSSDYKKFLKCVKNAFNGTTQLLKPSYECDKKGWEYGAFVSTLLAF